MNDWTPTKVSPTPLGQIRQSAGWTPTLAAKELGVSRVHLSMVENGRGVAGSGLQERMAALYSVPLEAIQEAVGKARRAQAMRTLETLGPEDVEPLGEGS